MKDIITPSASLPVMFPQNRLRKNMDELKLKHILENPPKFDTRYRTKYGDFVILLKGTTYDGRITSYNVLPSEIRATL